MASTHLRPTPVLPATDQAIRQAAAVLRDGGLVVFPTETVYGLGADAENPTAMRALFAAKLRPPDHPVIVHIARAGLIDQLAEQIPPAARQLAAAFWPGPMTLILRRTSRISDLVTGGQGSVGLRVPAHPVAQALLREFGGPIAAPSANRFGRVSPTRAEHVAAELAGCVDLILDGGPCPVGLESTIVDLTGERPAVLRPGAVTAEQIAAVLGSEFSGTAHGAPRTPGSLPSHYAPQAHVELVPPADLTSRAAELADQGLRVAILAPGTLDIADSRIHVLPLPQVEAQQARALYALMRQADELGCEVIVATLPVEEGLGTAIADRLRRAAGPRGSGNP